MKDYLLQHDGRYIECELNGLKLTYTFSDDPKVHYEVELRDRLSYNKLKNRIQEIYESHKCTSDGYWDICEFLHSYDSHEFFTEDTGILHHDLRDIDEIAAYESEACDKVWLMRSCYIPRKEPVNDVGRAAMERIFNRYDDIPEDGYSDWDCGYWNGIMGALRWVMGDEKDFLDT